MYFFKYNQPDATGWNSNPTTLAVAAASLARTRCCVLKLGNVCYYSVQNLLVFLIAIQKFKDQDI
jgi:hypothetical protein